MFKKISFKVYFLYYIILYIMPFNYKEYKDAYNKIYYQEKKEEILKLHKEHYYCTACKKDVLKYGKKRHERSKMHVKNLRLQQELNTNESSTSEE